MGNMKRYISILTVVMVVSLTLAPMATAWKWETHKAIVDKTYYAMPSTIKKKLNLGAMEDGSNDPDEKFHDTSIHNYPKSYDKAVYWLGKGKTYYKNKNYKQASYCFGVASHYISDTFSAPHCVSKESSSLHTKYEKQATSLKPVVTFKSGNLKTIMNNGYNQGKNDWNAWLKNKSPSIVQKDLNSGASAFYTALKNSIS